MDQTYSQGQGSVQNQGCGGWSSGNGGYGWGAAIVIIIIIIIIILIIWWVASSCNDNCKCGRHDCNKCSKKYSGN